MIHRSASFNPSCRKGVRFQAVGPLKQLIQMDEDIAPVVIAGQFKAGVLEAFGVKLIQPNVGSGGIDRLFVEYDQQRHRTAARPARHFVN